MTRPTVAIALLSSALISLPVVGQMTAEEGRNAAPTNRNQQQQAVQRAEEKKADKSYGQHAMAPQMQRVSKLIGAGVKTAQGDDLGEIAEIIVEPQTGEVKYVALDSGEILGVGGKRHAIPIQAFNLREDGKHLVLNVTRDQLKEAQGFEGDAWPDGANMALADPHLGADAMGGEVGTQVDDAMTRRFEPSDEQPGDQPATDAERDRSAMGEEMDATADRADANRAADADGQDGPSGDLVQQGEGQLRQMQQTMRDKALAQGAKIIPLDREHLWIHQATQLRGTDVRSGDDELGEIDDLVVNLSKGKLSYAVLSYGGTLGVNDKKVVVPWHAIDLNKEDQVAVITADRATLDQLAFEGDELPDLTDEQWVERTRRAFGDEPQSDVFGYSIDAEQRQGQKQPKLTPQDRGSSEQQKDHMDH